MTPHGTSARPHGDARPPWSLRTRLTLWTAGGSLAIFVASALFVTWLVRDSFAREMESLAIEELAELTYLFSEAPLTPEGLADAIELLDRSHPEVDIACRAWTHGGRTLLGTGGVPPVGDGPPDSIVESTWGGRRGPELHYSTSSVAADVVHADGETRRDDVLLELFLDGGPRFAALRRTSSLFLSAALFVALATIAGGALFARRVAGVLTEIAESAQVVRLDDDAEPVLPRKSPREIHEVIAAIGESLANMREEHARNVLLTAGLAHELRSPLQNLISEGEVTLLRERDGDEYRSALDRQLRELKELALVVDNLVTMTALRDTRHLPRRERFDLGAEAALRLEREAEQAERRGILVDIDQVGDMTIEGDREALVLMLRNLVANAVRWTAPNTTVSVVLDGTGRNVRLDVDDAGPGVPPESRERIFEAFHQETARSGERLGYGLGLALAKAAARAHAGEITVEESEAGGARFRVTIERGDSEDVSGSGDRQSPRAQGRQRPPQGPATGVSSPAEAAG